MTGAALAAKDAAWQACLCWYACMQVEVRNDVRKRRHLVSRITKAACWAREVSLRGPAGMV